MSSPPRALAGKKRRLPPDYGGFRSECDLAREIVRYLHDLRWEVYQEVMLRPPDNEPNRRERVADIVAVQDGQLWVVEVKLSFGLELLEQAYRWLGFANYVSVASPRRSHFGSIVCRRFGLGALCASKYLEDARVIEEIAPAFSRRTTPRLRESLVEKQKTFAEAGNAKTRFYSPFQATCEEILKVVTTRPGITLKELLSSIKSHYKTPESARGSIVKWADKGVIPGVEVRREDRKIALYPSKEKP